MAFWNKKKKYKEETEIEKTLELDVSKLSSSKTKTGSIKAETSTTKIKTGATKTLGRNIYYVSARKDKTGKKIGWEVKKENSLKVTRVVNTKEEAIEIVKELAGHNESTVIIRKVDGSIQETLKFKSK
jgi:uncharacterized protein YdaT